MWKHIETYLRLHRSDLDRDQPSPELWNRIARELDRDAKPARRLAQFDQWIRLAAAIVLIAGGAWLWLRYSPELPNTAGLLPAIHHVQNASPEWVKAEKAYSDQLRQLLGAASLNKEEEASLVNDPQLVNVVSELNEIRSAHQKGINQDSLLVQLKQKHHQHLDLIRQRLAR